MRERSHVTIDKSAKHLLNYGKTWRNCLDALHSNPLGVNYQKEGEKNKHFLALLVWKPIYLSSHKTAPMIFICFAHFLTQIQGVLWKIAVSLIDEIQRCLKWPQWCPTVQTPTEGFNVGIVPAGWKKRGENEQKLGNFCVRKLQISMRIPKTIILIHAGAKWVNVPGISHTWEQQKPSFQPCRLCKMLNRKEKEGNSHVKIKY